MENARSITEREYTTIPPELDGVRLDAALAALRPERSRAEWKKRVADGRVQVDDIPCEKPARAVAAGQRIFAPHPDDDAEEAAGPDSPRSQVLAEEIPLNIVYEDEHILVVDKPAGMAAHPGAGLTSGTLQNALLHHRPSSAALARAGIVHRLDKDTTGLLVAAKTERARRKLTAGFKARTIGREYLALVCGAPPQTGRVDVPLGRSRGDFKKMAARFGGREAGTRFAVEKRWRGFALIRCWLETGRTHQIRVHLEHAGFPLAGDRTYRRRAREMPLDIGRQCLHATALKLTHPKTGAEMRWESPLPEDFRAALSALDARAAELEKTRRVAPEPPPEERL